MHYLITGGAGFIGSHLAESLLNDGKTVTVFDNLSTGSETNLQRIGSQIEFVHGDILDKELISSLIEKTDVIYHLAAAVGVRNIIDKPIESLSTNYSGSENVLLAAAKFKKRIFIASTSEIYGKNPNQPLNENSDRVVGPPQKLRWTYSDAKALEEALAHALYLDQKLPLTTLRFFNTVGPRQSGAYGMVLPRFIDSALKGEPLIVHGNGSQTRVFCHVHDAIDALSLIEKNPQTIGQVFNIGGIGETSIFELAKRVIRKLNSNSTIEFVEYSKIYNDTFEDMERRVPDISKISKQLNWKPKKDLDSIIDSIVEEIRGNVRP